MKKLSRKLLGVVVAAAFIFASCELSPNKPGKPENPGNPVPENPEDPEDPSVPENPVVPNTSELGNLSSVEFAKILTVGWNLGNTLDATGSWTKDTETAWGAPRTTEEMIKAVHQEGFETIRIPVSWHDHVSGDNYEIEADWMSRVKTIVDWAYNDGMFVIINIHHDNLNSTAIKNTPGFSLDTDDTRHQKSMAYVKSIWKQVAAVFNNDYDKHLIFELLNEPRDVGGQYEWWMPNVSTATPYCETITALEQEALNVIRASGGNNANRFIMVPGYAASGTDQNLLKAYTMPQDSATDKLILSTHAYSPYDFAMAGTDTTFDAQDKAALDSIMGYLRRHYVENGIGVVMGESSASNKDNLEERIKWAEYYFGLGNEAGIPIILWDNMIATPDGNENTANGYNGEHHGYFNRKNLSWYFPTLTKTMIDTAKK